MTPLAKPLFDWHDAAVDEDVYRFRARTATGCLDEQAFLRRLRCMLAPFGLQRVGDSRWAADEVQKFLGRVATISPQQALQVDDSDEADDVVVPETTIATQARRAHRILGLELGEL